MKTQDEKPEVKDVKPIEQKSLSSGLPEVIELPANIPAVASDEPEISEYKGRYKNSVDGLVYALAVKEDAQNEKTHFLRNSKYLDVCTKQEFKDRYEKE